VNSAMVPNSAGNIQNLPVIATKPKSIAMRPNHQDAVGGSSDA
jgi:hypothetical protein